MDLPNKAVYCIMQQHLMALQPPNPFIIKFYRRSFTEEFHYVVRFTCASFRPHHFVLLGESGVLSIDMLRCHRTAAHDSPDACASSWVERCIPCLDAYFERITLL
uniref:AlNc14C11G1397 protein n=1 Tax=Albugo laibachii Nc14 TaxID=890382 RepID=F0W318_9STRA|nr:AlNc14C11G1397 [Albugo laibachii Nc14]|eukprot:CCA15455.1 AlNc14C11G1397 [Albugo laibachii Nc14]